MKDWSREPLTKSALITIIGSRNQQMECVESVPDDCSVRGPIKADLLFQMISQYLMLNFVEILLANLDIALIGCQGPHFQTPVRGRM